MSCIVRIVSYTGTCFKEQFGSIDYFFNNAGISGSGKYFLETDIEEIEQIVGINLLGALYGLRHVAEVMVRNGGEYAEAGIPQKRLGTSEEVAEVVPFLLTSKAQYINGDKIRIDCGFTNIK